MLKSSKHKKASNLRVHGFTLIELLVVISIIALLISILLPALKRARETAKGVVCLQNQKGIALAMNMYTDENKYFTPPVYSLAENLTWHERLSKYGFLPPATVDRKSVIVCPGGTITPPTTTFQQNDRTYGMPFWTQGGSWDLNGVRVKDTDYELGQYSDPLEGTLLNNVIFAADSALDFTGDPGHLDQRYSLFLNGNTDKIHLRHGDGGNVAFADGHAANTTAEELFDLGWFLNSDNLVSRY